MVSEQVGLVVDKAPSTGGDIRRIIDLFGLSVAGTNCYIATVNPP